MTNLLLFLFFSPPSPPSFFLSRSSGFQASDRARLPRKHHGGGGWSGEAGVQSPSPGIHQGAVAEDGGQRPGTDPGRTASPQGSDGENGSADRYKLFDFFTIYLDWILMFKWSFLHSGPAEQLVQGEHFASVQHHPGGRGRVHLHGREHPRRTDRAGHAVGVAGGPTWWDTLILTTTLYTFICNLLSSFIQLTFCLITTTLWHLSNHVTTHLNHSITLFSNLNLSLPQVPSFPKLWTWLLQKSHQVNDNCTITKCFSCDPFPWLKFLEILTIQEFKLIQLQKISL